MAIQMELKLGVLQVQQEVKNQSTINLLFLRFKKGGEESWVVNPKRLWQKAPIPKEAMDPNKRIWVPAKRDNGGGQEIKIRPSIHHLGEIERQEKDS